MAALVGFSGPNIPRHRLDLMMKQLQHRGNDETKKVEQGNVLMCMGISRAERSFHAPFYHHALIGDGIYPSLPDAQTLSHSPSPFVLAAVSDDGLFIARDPLGAKPLYYGYCDKTFVFASEVKALLQATNDVHEFPPGYFYTERQGFQPFANMPITGNWLTDSPDAIVSELKRRIEQAIRRLLISESVGVWLSGGVDSSVIAILLSRLVGKLHSFVIGLPGAPDLEYGGQVARILGTEHHAYTITFEDVLAALSDTIYALESFDALLVRSSVTHYLISKIASDYVEIVFTGEGGDELFAGYDYMKEFSIEELPSVMEQAIKSLHNTAFQRVDRCAMAHGLIPCVPFADWDVVEYALRIPPEYKLYQMSGNQIEKWILRRVMESHVPNEILWRPKTKFWQGTGLQDMVRQYAEQRVSDQDFAREQRLPNGWTLTSKEELLYYRIFKEHFGDILDLEWMGRTETPVPPK